MTTRLLRGVLALAVASIAAAPARRSAARPRARDLGVPFDGVPGPHNAITDVAGVQVGHATLVRGTGPLTVGAGPVRTGVTAVFPLGRAATAGVAVGWFAFNGIGELTGAHVMRELGALYGPVVLTNTLSVGTVQAAVVDWNRRHLDDTMALYARSIPVVTETWDGFLNDIYGQHVTAADVDRALDAARGGPVAEGNVGGGTGMRAFDFKGGIGTASRRVTSGQGRFTVGVLVQANYGRRAQLRIAGVPVGQEIVDLLPERGAGADAGAATPAGAKRRGGQPDGHSAVVLVATDAPLLPGQLERVARRPALALGRTGSVGMDGSGDIFLAFSTAAPLRFGDPSRRRLEAVTDLNPLFAATVQATEEAIVNALVAAETMVGIDGHVVHALPHDRLREVLARHGRLVEPAR